MRAHGQTGSSSRWGAIGWAGGFALSLLLASGLPGAAPPVAATHGAIYTSNADGTEVNENTGYALKSDVHLTGGPCQGGSHLAPGAYYWEISDPSTHELLSTDAIGNRGFTVGANGFIAATSGTHPLHAIACPGETGYTIQLVPFLDTTNNGGEYKLTIATAASVTSCPGYAPGSTAFRFCGSNDEKSDNFKVHFSTVTTTQVSASSVAIGGTVTDTAIVVGNAHAGIPAGTVSFYLCTGATCPTGGTLVGERTIHKSPHGYVATVVSPPVTRPAGTYTFRAEYEPARNEPYNPSRDGGANETFTVGGAPTNPPTNPPTSPPTSPPTNPPAGPTPTPDGAVAGVTSPPRASLPPTDLARDAGATESGLALALVALVSLAAGMIVLPTLRTRRVRR
ncbi:MAG: hypothetical protein RL338_417 [Chloroflexota bacterium]